MEITFFKYHGTGNDFILVDARNLDLSIFTEELTANLCHRKYGIGADGMILLLHDDESDFFMRYYNSDGREGTMCGNGGRCICSFARQLGIIETTARFRAIDGMHQATIEKDIVSLKMQNVHNINKIGGNYFVDTGSPHIVVQVEQPGDINIEAQGPKLRYDESYNKGGANVNFMQQLGNTLVVRTWERGVENETLSCGTGAVATAIIAHHSGNQATEYLISMPGGELTVSFTPGAVYQDIFLKGKVTFVFSGKLNL